MTLRLHPHIREAVKTPERRAKLRIDVLGQIEAHSVWRLRAIHLLELSEFGFSLEATAPFEPDAVHKFRIGPDGQGRTFIVQAHVRHCTMTSRAGALPVYVSGFEFTNLSDRTRRGVRALIEFAEQMWES